MVLINEDVYFNNNLKTLLAGDYKDPKLVIELRGGVQCEVTKNNDNFIEWKRKGFLESDCRAWKDNRVSGTLTTNGKTKVLETQNLKQQLCNELIQSGRVQEYDVIRHSYSQQRIDGKMKDIQQNNIAPTLDTRCDCLGVVIDKSVKPSVAVNFEREMKQIMETDKDIYHCDCKSGFNDNQVGINLSPTLRAGNDSCYALSNLSIRKLTPKECFRLMGVKDEDFEKIAQNQSNASLYHLAGDSIVVDVLMAIFGQMIAKN